MIQREHDEQRLNIFLTGVVRTGKTTALNAALSLLKPQRISGFRTVKEPSAIPQAIGEVYIVPSDGAAALDRDHLVGIRWGDGAFSAFPGAFEAGGCAILEAVPCTADLILMDELGVMEQQARRFCAAVLALLEGGIPVLGVIKPLRSPLLDAVRSHAKTTVIELNEGNRDSLPELIASLLRPQLAVRHQAYDSLSVPKR